jgi:hypothetical protein
MLVKPFTAGVNASGQATLDITHGLHGLTWRIYQLGFALGQNASGPQIAAHFNGVPLTPTIVMQPSVFGSIPGSAPYSMESFMVGPPYIDLEAGDKITCGVLGAVPGDTFTAAAYIAEVAAGTFVGLGGD